MPTTWASLIPGKPHYMNRYLLFATVMPCFLIEYETSGNLLTSSTSFWRASVAKSAFVGTLRPCSLLTDRKRDRCPVRAPAPERSKRKLPN